MRKTQTRILSLLLVLSLCIGLLATSGLKLTAKASGEEYKKITTLDELVDGQYALVAGKYAATTVSSNWIQVAEVTPSNDTVTDVKAWTLTVKRTSATDDADTSGATQVTVSIKNDSGYVKYTSSNNVGQDTEEYNWNVVFNDGSFRFATSDNTRLLFSNASSTNGGKIRCYLASNQLSDSNDLTSSEKNDGYEADFTLYKYVEGSGTPDETVDPNKVYTIAEALAANEDTTVTNVTGVVTYVGVVGSNTNVYIQDAEGKNGICLYVSSNELTYIVGDTVTVKSGTRASYNGLPELNVTAENIAKSSENIELKANNVTIDKLDASMLCTYVHLTDLEVTKVDDNDGTYTYANISVKDADGNTIDIYKAVIDKTTVGVGDTLDFTGALSINKTTYRLCNTTLEEIKILTKAETPPTTDPEDSTDEPVEPGDGYVAIYNPSNKKVMTTEEYTYTSSSGNTKIELESADATLAEGKLTTAATNVALFKVVTTDGVTTFTTEDGKYLYADGTDVKLVDEQGDYTKFVLETVDGGYYIKSLNAVYEKSDGTKLEQYIEFYSDYFTIYSMGTDATKYTFAFYPVTTTTEPADSSEPEESTKTPETTEATNKTYVLAKEVKDGDQIILVNVAYNKAINANTVEGNNSKLYLTGTSVTPNSSKITTSNSDIVWTVKVVDGGYQLVNAKGETISCTSGLSYGSSDNVWAFEFDGNTLKIKSTTGTGSSGDPKYIEWYSDYNEFSTYYLTKSDGTANDLALFNMNVYVLDPDATPVDPSGIPGTADSSRLVLAGVVMVMAVAAAAAVVTQRKRFF